MAALSHLWQCLARGAALNPAGVAIRDASRGQQLDYARSVALAERLAGDLVAGGLPAGARVGLCLPKSIESVLCIFGVQRARGAHVPVDYGAPAERNAWIFSNCDIHTLIVDARRRDELVAALADKGCTPRVIALEMEHAGTMPAGALEQALAGAATAELPSLEGCTRTDLGYILYTSGSTGVPKGVRISQGAALAFIEWCADLYHPGTTDRFSSHAPFHFDLSVLDIYVPLLHGARLVLIGEEDGKNPGRLVEILEGEAITHWYSTPSILTLMLQFGKPEGRDVSALRVVNFAGEVFPIKHLQALRALWPDPVYYNLYGPTETNVCTWHELPAYPDEGQVVPYPIGRVCPHYESLRVDHDGNPVTGDGEGLLLIRGEGVMDGYWNSPELDAKAFLEVDGIRWYNTGDVVQPNGRGELEFLGRRDRMVKKRGYRIELGEIEAALYRHPAVLEAAVLAVADADGGVRIRACLVPHGGQKLSIIALKRYSADNLLSYMVPDDFVFLESLPKTSTDKTDYQRLKEMVQ
jgi:amino acid adenylation domain-containing protein